MCLLHICCQVCWSASTVLLDCQLMWLKHPGLTPPIYTCFMQKPLWEFLVSFPDPVCIRAWEPDLKVSHNVKLASWRGKEHAPAHKVTMRLKNTTCLSVCLSICLSFIYPFIYLSTHPPVLIGPWTRWMHTVPTSGKLGGEDRAEGGLATFPPRYPSGGLEVTLCRCQEEGAVETNRPPHCSQEIRCYVNLTGK